MPWVGDCRWTGAKDFRDYIQQNETRPARQGGACSREGELMSGITGTRPVTVAPNVPRIPTDSYAHAHDSSGEERRLAVGGHPSGDVTRRALEPGDLVRGLLL